MQHMYCVEKYILLYLEERQPCNAFTVDDNVDHDVETTFFWIKCQKVVNVIARRLLAEAEVDDANTLLGFFVWRQDHEEALEGDGEVFQ